MASFFLQKKAKQKTKQRTVPPNTIPTIVPVEWFFFGDANGFELGAASGREAAPGLIASEPSGPDSGEVSRLVSGCAEWETMTESVCVGVKVVVASGVELRLIGGELKVLVVRAWCVVA